MIGDPGISDGAQIDGIEIPQLIESVRGHHPTRLEIGLATPVEMVPGKANVKAASGSFENAKALGHNLVSNAVPLNGCDLVVIHDSSQSLSGAGRKRAAAYELRVR